MQYWYGSRIYGCILLERKRTSNIALFRGLLGFGCARKASNCDNGMVMRELHAVVNFDGKTLLGLKRQALLFDKLHLYDWMMNDLFTDLPRNYGIPGHVLADLEFLESRELVNRMYSPAKTEWRYICNTPCPPIDDPHPLPPMEAGISELIHSGLLSCRLQRDLMDDHLTRSLAAHLEQLSKIETTPICRVSLSEISDLFETSTVQVQLHNVLHVALKAFPVPSETCSWQDILDFKAELHDEQWGFRRFLNDLAKKQQTEVEIADDINWTINKYRKRMNDNKIKTSDSFFEVYVIPTMELFEDLAKFNWSKIAKGVLAVRKSKFEQRTGLSTAPGTEVAYVFGARKRFGG